MVGQMVKTADEFSSAVLPTLLVTVTLQGYHMTWHVKDRSITRLKLFVFKCVFNFK